MQLVEIYKEIERFREEVIKVLNSDVISPLEVKRNVVVISLFYDEEKIETRNQKNSRRIKILRRQFLILVVEILFDQIASSGLQFT